MAVGARPTAAPPPAAVPPAPRLRRTGRARLWLALAVVAGALILLVTRLGDATVYFRMADEAVAQRGALGDRRFRIEGVVVDGSVRQAGNDVTFAIESRGVSVPVRHAGDPPELFKPNIPVVLEGRFDGSTFASDRIMVKHSESYRAEHRDRVKDYPGDARP